VGSVKGRVYQMEVEIVEEEGAIFGINVEHPIVTNGDFVV